MLMSHVPSILLEKLAALRVRERQLRLLWGAARVLAVALAVLLVCCLIDWVVDLWDDTPWGLRAAMLVGQLVVAFLLGCILVIGPQLRRFRDRKLALMVEEQCPQLQHRLISALELNQPKAQTAGMSPEMLAAVTREAVEQTEPIPFEAVADHRRVRRSAVVLAPTLFVVLGLAALFPQTALALLLRQLQVDVEIPRWVAVESATAEIWPGQEEVVLRIKATGPGVTTGRSGSVRVRGTDGRSLTIPLALERITGEESAIYAATVPPRNVDFSYLARVGDGRMKQDSEIKYVARPSIIEQKAWLLLPEYVGLRPDGSRYEKLQPSGDIAGHPGLSARIAIKTQKPIVRAVLETFGTPYPVLAKPTGLTRTQEAHNLLMGSLGAVGGRTAGPLPALAPIVAADQTVPLRRFEQAVGSRRTTVEWVLELRPTETSYRVVVFDEHGFASKTATVRTLKLELEPPPTVVLHAERFPVRAAFKSKAKTVSLLDFGGMPLPMDEDNQPGPLKISYEAHGPYGVGKAQLKIGVIRGANDSEGNPKKDKIERWVTLPLALVPADSQRPFVLSEGAFKDSGEREQIQFYQVPSAKPDEVWPAIFAGGRFDYQPAGFLNEDGTPFAFKPDDQVVVYIEVFNRNPDPTKALMGRSKFREKDLVPWEKFERWCYDTLQEASRIEALVYMQQQVYNRPWHSIFGFK
jgi:hypothetical protein